MLVTTKERHTCLEMSFDADESTYHSKLIGHPSQRACDRTEIFIFHRSDCERMAVRHQQKRIINQLDLREGTIEGLFGSISCDSLHHGLEREINAAGTLTPGELCKCNYQLEKGERAAIDFVRLGREDHLPAPESWALTAMAC